MKRRKKAKVLSFLLCILLIFTTFTPMPIKASGEDEGNNRNVIVTQEGKTVISAPDNMTGELQWQYYSDEYNIWINIHGENGDTCTLTYAKVYNMLDSNGQTQIRCTQSTGESKITSDPVTVILDNNQQDIERSAEFSNESMESDIIVSNTTVENFSMATASFENDELSDAKTYNETDSVETKDSTLITYNIVINYVFENNEIVAEPYTASLAAGSNFSIDVDNPKVLGYLPYVDDVQQDGVKRDYTNIQQDYTINVVYKPTNVDYTVIHKQQNSYNDDYTEVLRETKQGLTKSIISEGNNPEVAKDYEGFYALLYEHPAIAADGSTVVEVYYDRYYYLMNFDLDGGYGVEPIYARYGTTISNVGTPTKAGYTFKGWSLDGTTIVELPTTMPEENRIYKAIWEVDETAKVTIVFWGENANDEEYSYIESAEISLKPGTEFTYSEDRSLICGEEAHVHDENCGYACDKEEHIHTVVDGCYELTCTETSHSHIDLGCILSCTHASHTLDCYQTRDWYTLKEGTPEQTITTNGDGIYTYTTSNGYWNETHYYLYLNGKWYCYYRNYSGNKSDTQSIRLSCEHSHTDSCYSCGLEEGTHVHTVEDGCYTLICDKTEHSHGDVCGYSCGKTSHTHNFNCYMSGAGLDSNLWTFVKSDTVRVAADGSTVVNVYYDRTTFTITFKETGNNGRILATITDKWGADIKERFETISEANTFLWSQKTNGDSPWTSFMDIMPAENRTYYANTTNSTRTHTATYYGQNIAGTDYEVLYTVQVKYNGNLTVSKEEFENIEGFTFNSSKSSEIGDTYNGSKFYYDRNRYNLVFNNGYDNVKTESVKYEASLETYENYTPNVPSAYEPGSVTFGGWYLNPECTGTEFDLSSHTMPADNIILYAKWVPATHKVEFYLTKDAMEVGTKIGDTHPDLTVEHGSKIVPIPTIPKNGDYTFVGWFYMDGDTEKAFDFTNMSINKDMKVYGKWSSNVLKDYVVYYKIQGTNTEIADSTKGSALAGFTKTFEAKGGTDLNPTYQEGYFPVVKSHSLTIDIENEDKNSFTFWYVQKDAIPYTVRYLIRNEDGTTTPAFTNNDGTEYIYENTKNRKAVVTETFKVKQGYLPDAYQKRLIVSDEETAKNEIIFYYTADTKHAYYKITHYTENLVKDSDGNTIWTEYASSQAVGDIGTTYPAEPLTISGFTYKADISTASGELTANGLELKLYYVRNEYPYQVRYLEEGTGRELEVPKNATGKYGEVISESAINIDYYQAVAPTSKTLDIKIDDVTEAKINIITFYYKEKEVDLTIKKTGADNNIDENQSFIFHVTGSSGIDLTVTIVGNGSVTIKDLPHGTYTITEETNWSWRYTPDKYSKTIKLPQDSNTVVFANTRNNDNWLNGNANIKNIFKVIAN